MGGGDEGADEQTFIACDNKPFVAQGEVYTNQLITMLIKALV